MKLYCAWNSLKEIKTIHNLSMYYYNNFFYYEILIINENTTWYTEIWKDCNKCAGINIEKNNINLIDFIDNFESIAQEL